MMSEQIPSTYAENEKKSNVKLAFYTGIWLLTTALLAFGPKFLWEQNAVLTVIACVINLCAGGLMIRANIMHLRSLDELGRKIFLESAAITLGVLMVFGVCYELLFFAGDFLSVTPRISHIYFVMGFTFMLSTFLGHRRYR